jgi:hypothetical protein
MSKTKHALPNLGSLIGTNVVIRWVHDDLPRITMGPLGIHPHDLLAGQGTLSAVTVAGKRILLSETWWIVPEASDTETCYCDAVKEGEDAVMCELIDHPNTHIHAAFDYDGRSVRWSR